MPEKDPMTYSSVGVNYDAMDPLKKFAQMRARKTAGNLERLGMSEVEASRGESAYVWDMGDKYGAFVIEGLGTKNKVADEMREVTGKTYYDQIAQDTVAMIVNDLIVVGAQPAVVNAYFATGSSEWFEDEARVKDLVNGWARACNMAGATWGGGETPTLKGIIEPDTIDLSGAAFGVIDPKERLTLGDKLAAGDLIMLIGSNGIHANGLTLARAVAEQLPEEYETRLPNGQMYGEALLKSTHIYTRFVEDLFKNEADVHYMVNITGHGWRKLMRADRELTYEIHDIPVPQPEFELIQAVSGNNDEEMYGNFNMGTGFAVFIKDTHQNAGVFHTIAERHDLTVTRAGYVKEGRKQVNIWPKNITFRAEDLQVR